MIISLHQRDITDERVDAIVTAADPWLQHFAGQVAAIARKGGPQIEDECRRIMSDRNSRPLDVDDAVHTSGGNLPCRFVIHTVVPTGFMLDNGECSSLLRGACVEGLRLAAQLQLCSIAFPAINADVIPMPSAICSQVLFEAVQEFSSSGDAEFSTLREVRIVISDEETISVFREEFLKRYTSQETPLATNVTHQDQLPIAENKEHIQSVNSGKSITDKRKNDILCQCSGCKEKTEYVLYYIHDYVNDVIKLDFTNFS